MTETMNEMVDLLMAVRYPALARTRDRAARGQLLESWALHPQPLAPGSSLSADDRDFIPELEDTSIVSGAALYPVMAASDNLASVAALFDGGDFPRKLRAPSIMNLSRTALESAARTIWLLCEPDRDERRRRALGVMAAEMKEQQFFITISENGHTSGACEMDPVSRSSFVEHQRDFGERRKLVQAADTVKAPGFRETITQVSQWLNEHPPAHDTDQLTAGLTFGGKRAYAIGSATVHGYKWMMDYLGDGSNLFAMMADALAAGLIMTECAAALFEAQAVDLTGATKREQGYPDHLAPTVAAWSKLYR